MLAAIDLDDYSQFMTCEVSEVWTNRCLTSKVMRLKR